MKRTFITTLGLMASLYCTIAQATPPLTLCNTDAGCTLPIGANTHTQHQVYAGIVWQFNHSKMRWPNVQVGFQALNIHSSETVNGLDFSLQANTQEILQLESTRLVYIEGPSLALQGNVGFGYSFKTETLFGTLAAQTAYLRVGTDYLFNHNRFNPYLEGNTLKNPESTLLGCTPGTGILVDAAGAHADPNVTKDKNTCFVYTLA